MPQFLDTTDPEFEPRFAALLAAKGEDSPDVDAVGRRYHRRWSGPGATRL